MSKQTELNMACMLIHALSLFWGFLVVNNVQSTPAKRPDLNIGDFVTDGVSIHARKERDAKILQTELL